MKHFLLATMVAAATITSPAFAAVSVSVGEPGFYGRIDIGNYPPPQLIYAQPLIVEQVPIDRPPIYLRVPPGHAKHWKKHCHEYNACGERVYFVRDSWYNREYVPRYREQHRDRRDGKREDDHRGDRGNSGKGDDGRGHGRDH